MMVAHLVYSDGRRELYSRTVADESQPKIVEVGEFAYPAREDFNGRK